MPQKRPLISVAEALSIIGQRVRPQPAMRCRLADAEGLVLAAAVCTDIDSPPFDKAVMDGFAVRSVDCAGPLTTLRILGSLGAGHTSTRPVGPGEALRVNTGAPMPQGADAVVIIEDVEITRDGSTMQARTEAKPGQHVSPRGCEVRRGDEVIPAGTRLGPAQIAAASAAGAATVEVYRRPRLAVLVTGDELIPADQQPAGGQIRDANGPCLRALARTGGCEPVDLGTARDDPAILLERVKQALLAEVVCISGGVSMGQYDHVPGVLEAAGVQLALHGIAIKPGKPTFFGIGPEGQAVFGLPGNPVSAFVCFTVFVRAALAVMQGGRSELPVLAAAELGESLKAAGERMEFIPATTMPAARGSTVQRVRWQGSGDVFGLARANALIVRDPHEAAQDAGSPVRIMLLS